MKHGLFFLICLVTLTFLFTVVGVLAFLGYWNAEVIFWTRTPIKSEEGKLIWIIAAAIAFVISSVLSVMIYRKDRR